MVQSRTPGPSPFSSPAVLRSPSSSPVNSRIQYSSYSILTGLCSGPLAGTSFPGTAVPFGFVLIHPSVGTLHSLPNPFSAP